MDKLPEEIVNKIMLYAITTPSAECIKSVGYLEWRFLRAERYWYNYKSRKAKFIADF